MASAGTLGTSPGGAEWFVIDYFETIMVGWESIAKERKELHA